jgi:hypothetical protein
MRSIDSESGPTPSDQSNPDNLADSAIRAELERVLSTVVFQRSPQLRAFLRFVTEAALDGQQERIKAYTIAVDALGRSPNFNPDANAIVRVDAGRLRYALNRYYEGEGANDPVVISFSRGSYVPKFLPRSLEKAVSHLPLQSRWDRIAMLCRRVSAVGPMLCGLLVGK